MKTTTIFVKICFNCLIWCLVNLFRSIAQAFSLWFSEDLTKCLRVPFPLLFCSKSRSYSIRTRLNRKHMKNTARFLNVSLKYLLLCILNGFWWIRRIFILSIFEEKKNEYARLFKALLSFVTFSSYSIRLEVNTKYMRTTAIFVNVCLKYLVLCILTFLRLFPRILSLWIFQNLTKSMRPPFRCFVVLCDVQFLFNSIGSKYEIYENYYNIC